MNKKAREQLNQLSLEVFGSSSKWQKFVEDGELLPVMETVKVLDPATEEVREEQRQLIHHGANGGEQPKYEIKHYTPESIKERMITMLVQREQVRQMIAKLQKEQAEKRAEEAAQKDAVDAVAMVSGSAV